MRHAWSAVVQNSFVDRETGLVSLINVVEEITCVPPKNQHPANPPNSIPIAVHLVNQFWRRDPREPERGRIRIRMRGAEGQVLDMAECGVDLSHRKRQNIILKIDGIPYFGQGVYEFEIAESADGSWRPVVAIPLEIRLQPRAQTSDPSSI